MPGRTRYRAHAACITAQHAPRRCVALSLCCGCKNNGGGTPRARASAEAASAGCARGHWLSSPPNPLKRGSPKVRAVLASSRCGFRALRAAHLYSPILRLPKGGTLQGTLSAQQSADRSTRPDGRVAPASC